MSIVPSGEPRDATHALITAALHAIEDRQQLMRGKPHARICGDVRQAPSCSSSSFSSGEEDWDGESDTEGDDDDIEREEDTTTKRRTCEIKARAKIKATHGTLFERYAQKQQRFQQYHQNTKETRSWKVKALMALSQLTSLEQQCFEAERRACDLQSKYDALVLDRDAVDAECERYRAAWGDATTRVDALELDIDVMKSRIAMYEARTMKDEENNHDTQNQDDALDAIDEVMRNIRRREEQRTEHMKKIKDDEKISQLEKERQQMEDEYTGRICDLESQLVDLDMSCASYRQENESLHHTIQGLEERLLLAQSKVVQLQEENEYYACFMNQTSVGHTHDTNDDGRKEDDIVNDAIWELKHELGEREHELVAMQECLQEEKERSTGLHEQVLRQVMEIEDLRKGVRQTQTLQQELRDLKRVHAQTLEDMAQLKLLVHTPTTVEHIQEPDIPRHGRLHRSSLDENTETNHESWLM